MQANVDLHIEELVLDGFAAADRYRIAESLQRELERLFAKQGVPEALARRADVGRLDAGDFGVAPSAGPETVGIQVAQAVYGRISQ